MYRTTNVYKETRAQNSKNQPEPLLPTKSLNRSSNLYKFQKLLRPTFTQNHFSLQILSTIKAYKRTEPLKPIIVGLSGSVLRTKAYILEIIVDLSSKR